MALQPGDDEDLPASEEDAASLINALMEDLCPREEIPFVLGHALYMRAIHGGKAKNDKTDSHKIASRHGKGKALAILSQRLGWAVYFMLKNQVSFDQDRFLRMGA